jgi:pimeloyl-ACP methyl ester carboxylesterase
MTGKFLNTSNDLPSENSLRHHQVEVDQVSIHVIDGGTLEKPAVIFLHGWPENWAAFREVMLGLSNEAHVVSMDLPGVGASQGLPRSNDKRTLATYVAGVIEQMGLKAVALVGHDVGGQIVYSYLRSYPHHLRKAVIMNVAIPGISPWSEVKGNPRISHFTRYPTCPRNSCGAIRRLTLISSMML